MQVTRAMQVNIPKSYVDPFARYKRDLLIVAPIVKHGGQTQITNIEQVAKQLGRSPQEIVKFIAKRLGVRSDAKTAIFQGSHTRDKLEELLEIFIETNVLCKTCKNPETDIISGKKTSMKCRSCGFSSEI